MAVEGMTIINKATRASVLLCDKSTRASPRAISSFDGVPFKHIMDAFVNDRFSATVVTARGAIDRTGVRGQRTGFRGCTTTNFCQGQGKDRTVPGAQI